MLIGKAQKIVGIRHSAIIIQDFREHRRWQESGKGRQIHRRLGGCSAGEHAPHCRSDGENMAGLHQIRGLARCVDRDPHSARSIRRRDACIDARRSFNR